jgi:hypothetical protein
MSYDDYGVEYSVNKPLVSVYPPEGGDSVGLLQRGPKIWLITVTDHTDDGKLVGLKDLEGNHEQ